MTRRIIAHIDADAFYASVHLLEDPSLKGKPVVVAGSGLRSIVTTANYQARRFGIRSAQPAAQARRLCSHAVFLTPNFELYRSYSANAMAIVKRYCEIIEPLSLDEAYLDITELKKPVRQMREMIAEISLNVGVQYSIGIGPNKLCAKVLSDYQKPAAFNVKSREQCCDIFANETPRLIPGIGPKTCEVLERMGLATIAAIREASTQELEERFSARRADELQARARFEHDGIVQAEREVKSVSEERTFEHDLEGGDELERVVRKIAGELCERLQERELEGRTIGIKVRLADFTTVTRARTIDDFTSDDTVVAEIAADLLREYSPSQPVRLLGVRMASFPKQEVDESCFDDADAPPGTQLRFRFPQKLV